MGISWVTRNSLLAVSQEVWGEVMRSEETKNSIGGIIGDIIEENNICLEDIKRATGVEPAVIRNWKYGHTKPWLKIEAVLNSLGYDLEVIKRNENSD